MCSVETMVITRPTSQKILIVFFSEKVYLFLSREHLSCVMLEFSELTPRFMQLSLCQEAVLHFWFVYQHGLHLPFIIF